MGGQPALRLVRLNADGTRDNTFSASANSTVESIIVQSDGNILLAGGFDYINDISRNRVARVNTNGVLETTYNAIPSSEVFTMQLQTDGRATIGGGFEFVGSPGNLLVPHQHLGRILADGSVDSTYILTSGAPGVKALAFGVDGGMFVGGQFTTLGGFTRANLGRILPESAPGNSISNSFGLGPNLGATTLTWLRGGSGPEVTFTAIDVSSDGINFVPAGSGTRVSGGWQFSGINAPVGQTTYVRLRAYVQSGRNIGSFSALQSSFNFVNPVAPPIVVTPPTDLTVLTGSPASFTVIASNAIPLTLTYQWRHAGTNIPGATSSNLVIAVAHLSDAGNYDAIVSNGFSSVTSAPPAVLTVLLNTAPSFTKGADQMVLEDSGTTTVPGWATFISPGSQLIEAGQIVSFVITNNNNALFSGQPVVDSTGKLTFTPALNANGFALVTVVVQDNGGTVDGGVDKSTNSFLITVTAVNDAPSVTFASNVVVLEDSGARSLGGFAAFSPGPPDEAMQTVSVVSVNNNNNALFSVQPLIDNSGLLTFTPATNANGIALVTVVVQDNGGTANGGVDKSTNFFTITVTAVNDAPSFAFGAALQPAVISVAAGNDESGNDESYVVITNNTPYALQNITLSGTGYQAGTTLNGQTSSHNLPDIAAGQTFSTHGNGGSYYPFGGDSDDSSTGNYAITLSATLNGNPISLTFSPHTNLTGAFVPFESVAADGSAYDSDVALTLVATQAVSAGGVIVLEDSGAQNIANAVVNISAGPADESAQLVSFVVTNDNNALFSVQPFIDPTSSGTPGALHFTPAANANGSATVTVIAHDNGGIANGGVDTSAAQTFTITVTAVNDAPVVTLTTNNVVVLEDSGAYAGGVSFATFSPGPPNESGQTLLAHVLSNNNTGLFSVQPTINNSGTLIFTPSANSNGVANVTVVSQDSGGTSPGVDKTTNFFTITVTAVNDAPSVAFASNIVVLEDSGGFLNATFATFSTGPANESAQTITGV
ncbi:MAG: hypothetical protein HY300_01565, partial [Verrucomicrobia bacterium]|nr:hypothetical protein [Verrucomicrobiota bacterium]